MKKQTNRCKLNCLKTNNDSDSDHEAFVEQMLSTVERRRTLKREKGFKNMNDIKIVFHIIL